MTFIPRGTIITIITVITSSTLVTLVTQAIQILNDGQSRRLKYLISAYFVAWLILMLYIFHLSRKQEQLQTELDLLDSQLQPDGAKEDKKGI